MPQIPYQPWEWNIKMATAWIWSIIIKMVFSHLKTEVNTANTSAQEADQNDLLFPCHRFQLTSGRLAQYRPGVNSHITEYKGLCLDKSVFCFPLTRCVPLTVPFLRRRPRQTQRGDRGQRWTAHHQKEGRLIHRRTSLPWLLNAPGPSLSNRRHRRVTLMVMVWYCCK